MNLYLRFFNDEVLVETAEQAINFLSQIPEIKIDDTLCRELTSYAESGNPFPKRFKIGPKVYFIVIKTNAATMEEFKAYAGNVAKEGTPESLPQEKAVAQSEYCTEQPGWYQVLMKFKRVLPVEGTGKFRYVDTDFEVKLKAHSVQDCYNRVVDHLRARADVDTRSQFPSIRGRNFQAEYLGL
ncbi:MAG: hypothetical protein IJ064_03765 [Bacteroidaceae bacterium]|nr:hypothetical protein [Bacteroidaceae bacterium]